MLISSSAVHCLKDLVDSVVAGAMLKVVSSEEWTRRLFSRLVTDL